MATMEAPADRATSCIVELDTAFSHRRPLPGSLQYMTGRAGNRPNATSGECNHRLRVNRHQDTAE
jgi:hypothetical protein